MSCGLGCGCGSDPALLWLWHRLLAIAPNRPLAWEPPCAAAAALKRQKKDKTNKQTKTKTKTHTTECSLLTIAKTWKQPKRPLTDE